MVTQDFNTQDMIIQDFNTEDSTVVDENNTETSRRSTSKMMKLLLKYHDFEMY